MKPPSNRKNLLQFFKGLPVWGKIGWVILLGYIVGRIIYWMGKVL